MALTSRTLLDAAGRKRVVDAIGAAERRSHGEIRVHVEDKAKGADPVARARDVFGKLGMAATERRNGVLIYVAVKDRAFAVIGDVGIHEKVGDAFWSDVAETMGEAFARGEFASGLAGAITRAGEALAEHFPRTETPDVDELPDDISFGEEPRG